jgi:L-threonylcarbamoyladenylate synthase
MTNDINKSFEVLKKGGIILYPTDTIWGLGCDATNAEAVKRIYEIKQRADNKSMIILVDHPGRIAGYINDIPEVAMQLIELSDKPLTVILEGAKNLAANVINAEDGSVGIRVVNDPFCQALISRFKKPIVSTSANISGESSPACFDEISQAIIHSVDYVVEHRQDDHTKNKPSGIIKIGINGSVQVIRE